MLRAQCEECGAQGPLSAFTVINEKLCCQACTQRLASAARARGERPRIGSVIDPTVCYKCKRDNGSEKLPAINGLPYCSQCSEELYHRPLPQWLQLSLVGLLLLLIFALLHGKPYFSAGRDLLHGQKLLERGRAGDAIPYLQRALGVAPRCEEGVLLLGRAYFLAGRPGEGYKLLRTYNGGRFEKNALSAQVEQLYGRVSRAFQRAEQARKLYGESKWEEAARAMHEAARLYPEFPDFAEATAGYDGAVAFERKDYDEFLRIAEEGWEQHPSSPECAEMMASALACKYAITGEADYRSRSEQMLDSARRLAAASPEESAREKEAEARTQYRLHSRQIIDIDEYNRRFGGKQGGH